MRQGSVLIVEDDLRQRQLTATILEEEGYLVDTAANGEAALDRVKTSQYDVILTDVKMPRLDGISLLNRIQSLGVTTSIIIMTAYGSISSAVEAMREGAFYYLTKPVDTDQLLPLVQRAAEKTQLERENLLLMKKLRGLEKQDELIGQHPKFQEVLRLVEKVAPSNATVLLLGESGTGKEVVARAIHLLSPRANRPSMAINCAAIPDTLIESELFGYEKGAFTGATHKKTGLIESANLSTLLLDEIGDLSIPMQAKILRVLQEKEIRKLGGTEIIKVDVRFVVATNKDLTEEMQEGRFREDLFYRLNVISILLPPLRERRSDIPILADHFLRKHSQLQGQLVKEISPQAVTRLVDYDWPGNVRQLEAAIERATLLCERPVIEEKDLPAEIASSSLRSIEHEIDLPLTGFSLDEHIRSLTLPVDEHVRGLILRAMEKSGWVIGRAAKMLGISYKALQYRLDKFQIRKDSQTAA